MQPAGKVVQLDRPTRLMRKTLAYLADMDLFLSESEQALAILLDMLPHADDGMLLKMLPLIGYAGKDGAMEPLCDLMLEPARKGQVRSAIAVQLALVASKSKDPWTMRNQLIAGLNHEDPSIRSCCALALGWEGNLAAVDALATLLKDPDRDVQAAVVAALSSVGDTAAFNALTGRLNTGSIDARHSILLHLWRFEKQAHRVEKIYLDVVNDGDADLRMDALCALAMIPPTAAVLDAYRRLLAHRDPRVRSQVLANLSELDPADYAGLIDNIAGLLADRDARVRRAAVHLLAAVRL